MHRRLNYFRCTNGLLMAPFGHHMPHWTRCFGHCRTRNFLSPATPSPTPLWGTTQIYRLWKSVVLYWDLSDPLSLSLAEIHKILSLMRIWDTRPYTTVFNARIVSVSLLSIPLSSKQRTRHELCRRHRSQGTGIAMS